MGSNPTCDSFFTEKKKQLKFISQLSYIEEEPVYESIFAGVSCKNLQKLKMQHVQ